MNRMKEQVDFDGVYKAIKHNALGIYRTMVVSTIKDAKCVIKHATTNKSTLKRR